MAFYILVNGFSEHREGKAWERVQILQIPIGKIAQAIKDYDKAYHVDVGKGETVRVNKCPNCESVIYGERPITHGSLIKCDECNQEYEFQPRIIPLN